MPQIYILNGVAPTVPVRQGPGATVNVIIYSIIGGDRITIEQGEDGVTRVVVWRGKTPTRRYHIYPDQPE